MKNNIKVAVIGASGFTGRELVRLLSRHEKVEIVSLMSRSFSGQKISDLHKSLKGICENIMDEVNVDNICGADIVFLALPHTKSFEYVPALLDKDVIVIDLSADYRFQASSEYEKWYGVAHKDKKHLQTAIYAIPEINRKDIAGKNIIANPGCYATSVILGVYPLMKEGIIKDRLYVDAKSGISGAGKKSDDNYLYYSRYENLSPYKVNAHRHMGEILEFLQNSTGVTLNSFSFCPHLIPMERGILSTMYSNIGTGFTEENVLDIYKRTYESEAFINICETGSFPQTKDVVLTNNCNIGISYNKGTGDIIIMSVIDNLVKGASGQAIQNMNVAMGVSECMGLL